MTYQLSTVRTRIQQKLDNTSFDSAKLNQFINDGQREILNTNRFPFMESEATATTANGSDAITYNPVPSDLQQVLSVRVYLPDTKAVTLEMKEYEYVDTLYPNPDLTDPGFPQFTYIFNNTLKVFPRADATYTLKVKYLKRPAELVNDADVPAIPEEFGELLVLAGYKRALEHEDNFDQAQIVQQTIDEQRMQLVARLGLRHHAKTRFIKQPFNRRSR